MTKVIHVHLIHGRKNYYFGSISAIYTVLTEDEVGIKKSSLLHAGLADGGVILNKKAMIQQGELIRGPRADKEHPLSPRRRFCCCIGVTDHSF